MRCPRPGLSVMCHRYPSGTRAQGCPQQMVAPPRQMWDRGSCTPVGCGTGGQEPAVLCVTVLSLHAGGLDASVCVPPPLPAASPSQST